MLFCPNCGKEVEEGAKFCVNCGHDLVGGEEKKEEAKTAPVQKTDAISSLQKGVNIITSKPHVLVPALVGAVVSAVLSLVAQWFFPLGWWWVADLFGPAAIGLAVIGVILNLIGAVASYIMFFASIDMSRDAYLNEELDLSRSVNYVVKRMLPFILASIIGAILAITIILIPVVILMFVIMVIDETGIGDSISIAFKVLGNRLGDIIILIIIAIVGSFVLSLIPFIGSILVAGFTVLVGLAFIDIYYNYKKTETS